MASSNAFRKASMIVAGGGVYAGSVYLTYAYMHSLQPSKCGSNDGDTISCVHSPTRTHQFETIAPYYDKRIGWDETLLWMPLLRRWLLYWHAEGTVLEVGAGTARNLRYYPKSRVQRVLLTDASPQMLQQATEKVQQFSKPKPQFALKLADAAHLELPDSAFDCVVDTFGLCSFDDPVQVLRELSRVCKPNGKILLLEHGRSHSWSFVSNHLDRNAEHHAEHWGCVWNRDLDAILNESGLEIESLSRWHFGTTYYVVARPAKTQTLMCIEPAAIR
jgi:methyltransferase OMS1, mitochondrial